MIRLYQLFLSPVITFFFGPVCRYQPTCSEYAFQAFSSYPFFVALYLSVKRVLRCHPWKEGGEDPLPDSVRLYLGKHMVTFHAEHDKNK